MSPDAAIDILKNMKRSYLALADDASLEASRRVQAGRRMTAIDTAIVALTRVEAFDEIRSNSDRT